MVCSRLIAPSSRRRGRAASPHLWRVKHAGGTTGSAPAQHAAQHARSLHSSKPPPPPRRMPGWRHAWAQLHQAGAQHTHSGASRAESGLQRWPGKLVPCCCTRLACMSCRRARACVHAFRWPWPSSKGCTASHVHAMGSVAGRTRLCAAVPLLEGRGAACSLPAGGLLQVAYRLDALQCMCRSVLRGKARQTGGTRAVYQSTSLHRASAADGIPAAPGGASG